MGINQADRVAALTCRQVASAACKKGETRNHEHPMFMPMRLSDRAGLARRQANTPSEKRAAAALSMMLTAGLFALVLLASAFRLDEARPARLGLIVTTFAIAETASPDLPEGPGGSAAPASTAPRQQALVRAPATIAPVSALPAPLEVIKLAPLDVPYPSLANQALAVTASAKEGSIQAQLANSRGAAGDHSDTGDRRGKGPGSGTGDGRGERALLKATWAPNMDFSQDRRSRHYPPAALEAGVEGVAWLKCFVLRRDRVRDCQLLDESPQGYKFGEAALKTEPELRIRLHDQSGRRVYDDWTVVTSRFTLPDAPKQAALDKGRAPGPASAP